MDREAQREKEGRREDPQDQIQQLWERVQLGLGIPDMENMCNLAGTLGSLLAQGSDGAALCGAEGADNEGREADGIMAPGLADTVLGIRRLIYGQEATDLVLDINTAGNRVSVSGDRKSASRSLTKLHYPQSPERFQWESQALSSRSFPSGRHYWEVEVSESGHWGVGAAYPSIERGGDQSLIGYNNKSWGLDRWNNNRYSVRHDSEWTDLPHVPSCRRIRIWLDYEAGRLSFYELSEPIRHLHTFTASFTEPLHAAFWVRWEGAWVRIIRERDKGAEVLTLERETDRQIRDSEDMTPGREKLDPETRMQEEAAVSHIIHKGETEREELAGQIPDMEELCNLAGTLGSLLAQGSDGAALCGAEGADNEGREADGIMAPGLADTVLGIRRLIYGQEATDLVLDINTAHNHVSVSGDRKSASYSLTELHYPQSPERFQLYTQALSSRSFPSGRHYWEVEGSESGEWGVGAAYPSIERGGYQSWIGYNNKSWGLYRWDNNYTVVHDSRDTELPHVPSCRRIRISLDYEAGRLSFYELSEPIRHLHTITASFTEPLHAAFWVRWEGAWVRIIREREKGAEVLTVERETDRQIRDSEDLTPGREKLDPETRMQEEGAVSHIIHKGETEREELAGQIPDMEELYNLAGTLGSLLAQGSDGAALCGAEGADNEGREADGIMAPGLADTVLGIRRLIYGQEATDLVLDINTAHNEVSVSGDRKSASRSLTKLHYPQSPERFQDEPQALSTRSFPSGQHYWEVEGSESGGWGVGAAYPSIERGGGLYGIGNNNKSWCLERWDNNYTVVHDREERDFPHIPPCRRIRISLDYEAGRLSFYELSEPIRRLHTFTASFTEPLHAAFWVWGNGAWVRIIREREKGAEVLTLERETDRQIRDSEDLTPGREKLEEGAVSHIIHKGETEREELAGQIPDMEELCNLAGTLGSLLAQGSDGAALCGAEGADNEGREADGIMAPGLADTVLGIRRLIYGQEATDLVLDINTAHNRVSVSGDRKSASYSLTELHYPQSPERFQLYAQALSSRSFPSGRHYCEVEVSESGGWGVGAAYPSIERGGGQSWIGNNNKSWCLCKWDNNYTVRHDKRDTDLPHVPSCRRIRISLDYEAGRLSFYELSEPIRRLHTFTASFTEPLHAAFWVGEGAWVRIIRK
uniref:B30.2/SPRY domain-containing protein n=1 Tax=Xenopus tropicalis TaxID=8364 RepID=A0A1B8XZV1_XENTR